MRGLQRRRGTALPGRSRVHLQLAAHGAITYGGYSTHIVVEEKFVLSIPDELPLDAAAPLLCAGITMYSPLRRWNACPESRVAILGMGGLGHIGVKIARMLDAEVTVLSSSRRKLADGLRLGADHWCVTEDEKRLRRLRGRFDLILNTVSADLGLDRYLELLAPGGTLVELGLPSQPLRVDSMVLARMRRTLAGSMIGGIGETQEMLRFCAAHRIAADIELITANRIDSAFRRIVAGDVRYRFVIDAATI